MAASRLAAAGVLGYLLGTVPSADLATKAAARRRSDGPQDLREAGTGNPGAANAAAVLGARWGAAVLVADIAKGAAASAAGRSLAGPGGAHLAGTAAVLGHCWPAWNGFRGGKGVATSAGQCLATFPAYVPLDVAVAAATASSPRWRRRAYAATTAASTCWVVAATLWWRRGWPNLWGPPPSAALPAAAAASSAVILHRFSLARSPR